MSRWIVLLFLVLPVISDAASDVLTVTIPAEEALHPSLGGTLILPCTFQDSSPQGQAGLNNLEHRIKWSIITKEKVTTILVAMAGTMRISENYVNRVSLVEYPANPSNATISISGLRYSDAGFYRCEIQYDIEDNHDFVYVQVEGIVFHYRSLLGRYALTYNQAEISCEFNNAVVASPEQLQAAFEEGFHQCDAGWLNDHTVRYPNNDPQSSCGGTTGIKSYGVRNVDETYDAYCFIKSMKGRVFYIATPEKYSMSNATIACFHQGAALATTGQLYLAWQGGMDVCNAGWLADGSVRYPINVPRPQCGGGAVGVRTVYVHRNQTGYPDSNSQYDAYCYREFPDDDIDEDYGTIVETSSGNSGDDDQFTVVEKNYAESNGVVFHYRKTGQRYAFTFVEAQLVCINMGATIATSGLLQAAYEDGYNQCDAGWILDQTSRYPIVFPRPKCAGNLGVRPGVRSYGLRPAIETYDVYCYIDGIEGEVMHVGAVGGFTYDEATSECEARNASLASTAQLYAAWKTGFDKCRAGWLADKSVRYPINNPSENCGAGKAGVHTVYADSTQITSPPVTNKYDAYCYKDVGLVDPGSGSGSGGDDSSSTTQIAATTVACIVEVYLISTGGDVCSSNPCVNGATCMDNGGSFECLCLPGYEGERCQLDNEQCDSGWTKFQGNCYLHMSHPMPWEDAELFCQTDFANLAVINTPEEQAFVSKLTQSHQWIGMSDRMISFFFQWVDGSQVQYMNWMTNRPSYTDAGRCVAATCSQGGGWDDMLCTEMLPFTCKKGTVLCGLPPHVTNAAIYSHVLAQYPVNSVVRYRCDKGFTQRYNPVIHCQSDGQWETPQIECTENI
ncbi:aggrecan core protein-like [Antennarius striatus]|uniref:aggrecan core protein-like n=1 Tax=Antennarius striatus TaxID=241820 RepID=UPI0035B0242F